MGGTRRLGSVGRCDARDAGDGSRGHCSHRRHLARTQPSHYDGNVVLYLADRYHDGMIELEPRFADRVPNGGWDEYIPNLEVVHIVGDHLQIIDEPRIGKIGADLTAKLAAIEAKGAK